jgi:hypothetical protein
MACAASSALATQTSTFIASSTAIGASLIALRSVEETRRIAMNSSPSASPVP